MSFFFFSRLSAWWKGYVILQTMLRQHCPTAQDAKSFQTLKVSFKKYIHIYIIVHSSSGCRLSEAGEKVCEYFFLKFCFWNYFYITALFNSPLNTRLTIQNVRSSISFLTLCQQLSPWSFRNVLQNWGGRTHFDTIQILGTVVRKFTSLC